MPVIRPSVYTQGTVAGNMQLRNYYMKLGVNCDHEFEVASLGGAFHEDIDLPCML